MKWSNGLTLMALCATFGTLVSAAPRPVPLMQAMPLPNHEVSFQRDGTELTRYFFGPDLRRSFLFPVIGPSGRSLTRMGHPHDPESHSHHNSIWVSHASVDGVSFWDDRSKGRIVHQRLERLDDSDDAASVLTVNSWVTTNQVLLTDRRLITVRPLSRDEWLLIIDLQLEPRADSITFDKTPFGLVGVRMAKTIGVHDGGGGIRNSEGGLNETNVLWKRARWVDYSGPITRDKTEGITLLDHPSNPNHPTFFHVRNDGWMGASLTYDGPRTVERAKPLKLRYGCYVHAGAPATADLDRRWRAFADLPVPSLEPPRRANP
ncbi:MAG TPA: PmoA family protein [Candidatus Binatia bacterium]|nr:PmoA family protein [Candidatus Binatia bacterium]